MIWAPALICASTVDNVRRKQVGNKNLLLKNGNYHRYQNTNIQYDIRHCAALCRS